MTPETTIRVLSVEGDLDIATVGAIRSRGRQMLMDDGISGLVVDLQKATFLDSMGLGALIELRSAATSDDMSFTVINAPAHNHRTIEISGLRSLFGMAQPQF